MRNTLAVTAHTARCDSSHCLPIDLEIAHRSTNQLTASTLPHRSEKNIANKQEAKRRRLQLLHTSTTLLPVSARLAAPLACQDCSETFPTSELHFLLLVPPARLAFEAQTDLSHRGSFRCSRNDANDPFSVSL